MLTTDPQDEIFPVVNEHDEVIGKITRSQAHRNPAIIHRAVAVLIYDAKKRLLVQKRSLTKDTCPGYWAESVAGHVGYAEEYLSVAVRETYEELGISLPPGQFTLLGKKIVRAPWETEMIQVYMCILKGKTALRPNPEEVSCVVFLDRGSLSASLIRDPWTPGSLQILTPRFLRF
jgi:isopentenyl-diphosphate delta-isomerase type 1